ncbi:MAG: hypothetical protein GY812_03370 [Actinomycetia bacterium]|nr:hypothetical protein [Actinomycetes bacterium]
MSALLIGLVVVVGSAALFGLALFGRRPIPQPAMAGAVSSLDGVAGAETAPSRFPGGELTVAHISGIDTPVLVQAPDEPIHLKASDVRVSLGRRIRAAVLLAVSVFGTAMLIGAIVSILVVSAVLVIA